jgi:hypothetical protein
VAIVHTSFVLAAPDLAEASTCWREVSGFTRQMQPEGWDFLVRDGCRVMLGECVDDLAPAALGSHSYFGYFTVDDIDAYHREISARRHHSVTALQQAAGHARNGRSHATGPPDDVRPADLARTRHATDTRR